MTDTTIDSQAGQLVAQLVFAGRRVVPIEDPEVGSRSWRCPCPRSSHEDSDFALHGRIIEGANGTVTAYCVEHGGVFHELVAGLDFAPSPAEPVMPVEVAQPAQDPTVAKTAPQPPVLAPIDGAELLDDIVNFVRRYVVLAHDEQALALALWVLHSHAFAAADESPLLIIHAPERRCGKSLLRDVLAVLVREPWGIDGAPTEAVIFRKIATDCPTILLDEADALFNGSRERVEPLRAIFNSGNRRGTTIPRCVGDDFAVRDFDIFSPKALIGIDASRWPATLRDRAILIELRRKRADEKVERFRRREVAPVAKVLRERCARWASTERVKRLSDARPYLPDELNDRQADIWEALLAIADDAGGEAGKAARYAALALSGEIDTATDGPGIRLLSDIKQIFAQREGRNVSTADLLAALHAIEAAPWGDDPRLSPRRLADLLRRYGLRPTTVRLSAHEVAKGYARSDFADAFSRYLTGPNALPSQVPLQG